MTVHAATKQRSRRWAVMTAVAGTVFIAAGAFWLSFTALADLAARSGVGGSQAWAWPLIVDGIIVVATVAVVALAGQKSAWYPWALLIGGAAVSVTANAIHAVVAADADVPGVLAAAVAAVPPVVLLAITHLTVILTRGQPAFDKPVPTDESRSTDEAVLAEDAVSGPQFVVIEDSGAGGIPMPAPPHVKSELPAPKAAHVSAAGNVEQEIGSGAVTDRRAVAAELRGQGWSNKKIARELGVHPSTVGRWFTGAHLPDSTDI